MAALKNLLPAAKSTASTFYDHSNDQWFKQSFSSSESDSSSSIVSAKSVQIPPYTKRQGFIPRKPEDFGDGGAFPEIHVAQYPLGMGWKGEKLGSKILPLTVDAHGKVAFSDPEDDEEMEKEIQETMQSTIAALEKIMNTRLSAAQPKNVPSQSSDSKFINYKPLQQSPAGF